MHDESDAALCSSPDRLIAVVQRQPQILTAPAGAGDPRIEQPCGQVGGTRFVTTHRPRVVHPHGADGSTLTPKRTESVTAPQALALLNDEFVLVHAKAMAARLGKHSTDRAQQIEYGCQLVWSRSPTADEAKLFAAYANKHGLANLCRVLFNTNEFLFAD